MDTLSKGSLILPYVQLHNRFEDAIDSASLKFFRFSILSPKHPRSPFSEA